MIKLFNHHAARKRQTLFRIAFIGAFSIAMVYLIISGRQSTLEMLVMLVVLSLVWKIFGPVGLLSLLGMLIWSSKPVPGLIQKLTGSLWTYSYLIEFGIIAWLGLLVSYHALLKPQGEKRLVLPLYYPVLVVILFGWVFALLSGAAPDLSYAWQMFLSAGITPIALYFLVINFVKSPRVGQSVLYGLILGGLILATFQLTRFRYIAPISEVSAIGDADRLTGSFALGPLGLVVISTNNTALYYGMLFALVYSLAINLRTKRLQWPVFGAAGVLGWVIVQMGTRSVWIGLSVALLVISIVSCWANPNVFRRIALFWLSVALCLVLLLYITQDINSLVSEDVSSRMQTMSSLGMLSTDPTWLVRVEQWRNGLALLLKYPLGTGYLTGLPPYYVSMHNEYLALALASGIPGLFALLVFLGLAARRIFLETIHSEPASPYSWILPGALGSMIVFAISVFATDPSKKFYPYMAFWLILSVGMAVVQNNHRQPDLLT